MLDQRRSAILQAVVREYVRTSQPVSSAAVASSKEIAASSATVRAEMSALEQEGFLRQPHASAGRVPTDRAYRVFVDHLSQAGGALPADAMNVANFFAHATGELEQMLSQAGQLLSTMTGSASVVVSREDHTATVRSVQILKLSERTALGVVVYADGNVEKSTFVVDTSTTDADAAQATAQLNALAVNKRLNEVEADAISGKDTTSRLMRNALLSLQEGAKTRVNEKVVVVGASQLASSFEAVEVVRNVLTILEQQYVVVSLVRDLLERGVSVAIGEEHKVVPLAECSVVVAPTLVEGQPRGSVAVLGPTRMDYAHAIAAVSVVSEGLGEKLAERGK